MLWRILKQAAAEAGASISEDDDPPLSATEALSVCPELNTHTDETIDRFELDDHTYSWLERESDFISAGIRGKITRDQWQAIVAITKDLLGAAPWPT